MISMQCEVVKLEHREARDDFSESWLARLLDEAGDVYEATVNDPQVASALAKLPRRGFVTVMLTVRPVRNVWNAYRFYLADVGKANAS